MKKETKKFIGTIAGALVGSTILNSNYVLNFVGGITSPTIAKIIPVIGLVLGGIIGYYVAKNS